MFGNTSALATRLSVSGGRSGMATRMGVMTMLALAAYEHSTTTPPIVIRTNDYDSESPVGWRSDEPGPRSTVGVRAKRAKRKVRKQMRKVSRKK